AVCLVPFSMRWNSSGRCREFLRPDQKRYLYGVPEQRDDAKGTGILSGTSPGGEICMKIE
ncbi:hypothetical protein ACSAKG_004528, partial [Salmonella enterica subsp. enterica]